MGTWNCSQPIRVFVEFQNSQEWPFPIISGSDLIREQQEIGFTCTCRKTNLKNFLNAEVMQICGTNSIPRRGSVQLNPFSYIV